jgi:hypothetical protein
MDNNISFLNCFFAMQSLQDPPLSSSTIRFETYATSGGTVSYNNQQTKDDGMLCSLLSQNIPSRRF